MSEIKRIVITIIEDIEMTKSQAIKLLKELIQNIDYDIYKSYFVNPEEPEFTEQQLDELIEIIQKHVK